MGTLTLGSRLFEDTGTWFDEAVVEAPREPQPTMSRHQHGAAAGGLTLEDVIVATWEHIASGATASCPICHSELRPIHAGSGPVTGRCQDCGSHLS
jgi:hypothetical protein